MPQHSVLGGGIIQMSETPTSLYRALWGVATLSTQLSRLITNHLIFALGRIRTYMRPLRGLAELTVPSSLQEHIIGGACGIRTHDPCLAKAVL